MVKQMYHYVTWNLMNILDKKVDGLEDLLAEHNQEKEEEKATRGREIGKQIVTRYRNGQVYYNLGDGTHYAD